MSSILLSGRKVVLEKLEVISFGTITIAHGTATVIFKLRNSTRAYEPVSGILNEFSHRDNTEAARRKRHELRLVTLRLRV